jgi:hypothetical protein
VDWFNGKLRIERSMVRQQVDDVKTIYSGKMMSVDSQMLGYWVAGGRKLGSHPLCRIECVPTFPIPALADAF